MKQLSVIYFVCSHDPSHSSLRKHKVGLICRICDKVSVCHDVLSQLNLETVGSRREDVALYMYTQLTIMIKYCVI